MKKTLLALGAAALMTLGLASCGTNDCVCTATVLDVQSGEFAVTDYDGDCEDIVTGDEALPTEWQDADIEISCEEGTLDD